MADAVKDNTVYAVEVESTEGTYVAPTADTSYVQTLSDGAEINFAQETLERDINIGSIGKAKPRTGTKTSSGSMPVELRAGETEGQAPEFDGLIRSAMGLRRQVTATTIDNTDSAGTHTTTRIYLADADGSKYQVGDTVTIKSAGSYHTSPVTAVSSAAGDSYIDLLVADDVAPSNGDEIAALTTYVTANSGHPSLSISKYIEQARLERVSGARVTSMALENFTTGQLASLNFGFESLEYKCELTAQPHTPAFQDQQPPIMLGACVYMDGVQIAVNEFNFSLENTLGFKTSTCSKNGRISSRPTERTISGSFTPYKQDDDISICTKFECNESFSLFATANLPNCPDDGQYAGTVSFYIPNASITEVAEGDQDGLLQQEVSFSASRGDKGTDEELFITFS